MCSEVQLPVDGFQFKDFLWSALEELDDHIFQILLAQAAASGLLLSHFSLVLMLFHGQK